MADALVSLVLGQLASILRQQIEAGITLVVGVDEEVRKLTGNFHAIQAVLEDAENQQVKKKAVRDWLEKLKDTSYDMDDVLDEWNTAIRKLQIKEVEKASMSKRKVCSLIPSYCFSPRHVVLRNSIASKIKDLNITLDNITKEKNMFGFSLMNGGQEPEQQITASFIEVSKVHGRDQDKKTIVNLLLSESSQGPKVSIISIVGMAGIGKTTLARLAFNDDEVNTHFDKKIWICVSHPFNEIRIAKAILESLKNDSSNLNELETVLRHIQQHLEKKKFFLVLDDVWTEDPKDWEQLMHSLKFGSQGSRILMTTRKENVAQTMGTTNMISLGILPEEDCWSLFAQLAFSGRTNEECEKLKNIGREIVCKCKGLPLAIKTLGSLLFNKRKVEEWQRVSNSDLWGLEEVERRLFPVLLLSYYDLPSKLRICFQYCAIFSKDYEIEKDKLIKLWMAQGYLEVKEKEDMELIGEEYFENLAMRSFFQDFKRSEYDSSIISCKMHDIVHDFAQFLTKNECFAKEVDGVTKSQLEFSYKKARHSMMIIKKEGSFPITICDEKKLRSLVVDSDSSFTVTSSILSKLFNQLIYLRTLDLNCRGNCYIHSIIELPRGIKSLIHLRYLNLSRNLKIKELPEELCDLYNLQTLDITYCWSLQNLPEGIGKLINLRHLINTGTPNLCYMPKGIERLTCLHTLSEFVVSNGSHCSKASSLECLNNLNHLQGFLVLRRLGYVTDVGEAEKAELKSKNNLLSLSLWFRKQAADENIMNVDNGLVLDAFQPPPNLEKLEISSYKCSDVLPNWIVSLTKLRVLVLNNCTKCELLPSLGKLSSLESLNIVGMRSVRRVGNEFLGIECKDTSLSSSIIAFPKLKSLIFKYMDEWEEWNYGNAGKDDIIIMPCLCYLKIEGCPRLKALPNDLLQTKTLEKVEINWCLSLGKHYLMGTGKDCVKSPHICIQIHPSEDSENVSFSNIVDFATDDNENVVEKSE